MEGTRMCYYENGLKSVGASFLIYQTMIHQIYDAQI